MTHAAAFQDGQNTRSAMSVASGKPELLGTNTKGKINKFATLFTLDTNDKNVTTLKATRTPSGSDGYTAKKGIVGYVAVNYTQLNGVTGTTYLKVTAKNVTGAAK